VVVEPVEVAERPLDEDVVEHAAQRGRVVGNC
jgi:hypothetical protein